MDPQGQGAGALLEPPSRPPRSVPSGKGGHTSRQWWWPRRGSLRTERSSLRFLAQSECLQAPTTCGLVQTAGGEPAKGLPAAAPASAPSEASILAREKNDVSYFN